MTAQAFLVLFFIFSVITSLITEGIKTAFKKVEKPYAANIVVLVVAVLVGVIGTLVYYYINEVSLNFPEVVYIILVSILNWVGAMIGYDKVIQALNQLKDMKMVE